MTYQMTFKRYELKYMINRQQKENMLQSMETYMKLDQYKRTTIRNILVLCQDLVQVKMRFSSS